MTISGINWLGSYPKSGNTWVRAFLTAYLLGDDFDLNRMGVIGNSDTHSLYWQPLVPKPLDRTSLVEMSMYRPAAMMNLLQTWSAMAPVRNPVVKTHVANVRMTSIDLFPVPVTAAAVYVVRDPRDVLPSFARWFDLSINDAVDRMSESNFCIGKDTVKQPLRSWSQHVQSWADAMEAGHYPVIMIRYEDLLDEPHDWFEEVLTLFGWDVDRDRVDAAVRATTFDELRRHEAEHGMIENRSESGEPFFRQGRAGGWRDELSEEQVSRVERDHGDVMKKLGYELVTAG